MSEPLEGLGMTFVRSGVSFRYYDSLPVPASAITSVPRTDSDIVGIVSGPAGDGTVFVQISPPNKRRSVGPVTDPLPMVSVVMPRRILLED